MWIPVPPGNIDVTQVTSNTRVTLLGLETQLTTPTISADPPEDLTVLRVVGMLDLQLEGNTAGLCTVAFLVTDSTWPMATVFEADSDKRILWHRTFVLPKAASENGIVLRWSPPGTLTSANVGGVTVVSDFGVCSFDFSPKVKLESGKALYLAVYVTGVTVTLESYDMRLLCQRSRR